jgi:FlaA1/EpsC-like NDP-sugar epimerase
VRISAPVTRHRLWQLAVDAVLVGFAWWASFFLCFDQNVPRYYQHFLSWQVYAVVIAIALGTFVLFGFYNRWWRYVSTRDMWGAFRGVTVACLVTDLVLYAIPPAHTSHLPKRIVALDYLILLALVAGTRLLARSLISARPAASWHAAARC